MARMTGIFVLIWVAIMVGIMVFRSMSGLEKWEMIKTLTFSAACAIMALVLLMALVIVF